MVHDLYHNLIRMGAAFHKNNACVVNDLYRMNAQLGITHNVLCSLILHFGD